VSPGFGLASTAELQRPGQLFAGRPCLKDCVSSMHFDHAHVTLNKTLVLVDLSLSVWLCLTFVRPVFEPPSVIINPWMAIAYCPGTLCGFLSWFMTWLRL